MLIHYLKVAIRNLLRDKLQSIIGILGLSLGLLCLILGLYWFWYETNYDRKQPDIDRIYQIMAWAGPQSRTQLPSLYAEDFKNKCADIEAVTYKERRERLVKVSEDKQAMLLNMYLVDRSYLTFFELNFRKALPSNGFRTYNEIILTESTANRLFQKVDVEGESLLIFGEPYTIVGVVLDREKHSLQQFDCLLLAYPAEDTSSADSEVYVKLNKHTDQKRFGEIIRKIQLTDSGTLEFDVCSLKHSKYQLGTKSFWDAYASLLIAVAGIVLIAVSVIFNFLLLNTARFLLRLKEFHLRKSLGGVQKQLVGLLYIEMLLSFLIAVVIVLVSVELIKNSFIAFVDIGYIADKFGMISLICILSFLVFILLGGLYPIVYAKSHMTDKLFVQPQKGEMQMGVLGIQMSIGIAFLLCIYALFSQFYYLTRTNFGFETNNILRIDMKDRSVRNNSDVFCENMKKSAFVESYIVMGYGDLFFGGGSNFRDPGFFTSLDHKYGNTDFRLMVKSVRQEMFSFFDMKFISGRPFEQGKDASSVILNKEAVKQLGLKDPIGQKFTLNENKGEVVEVIGVLEDFHSEPFTEPMKPTVYFNYEQRSSTQLPNFSTNYQTLYIKYKPGAKDKAMADALKSYRELALSDANPEIVDFSDYIKSFYETEQKVVNVFNIISLLSILIVIFGIYAMLVFTLRRRRKEIAIRKILGANLGLLVGLFGKKYLILVSLSSLVALPIAYYSVNQWLDSYAYRVDIHILLLPAIWLLMTLLVLFIVFIQILRAMKSNPVEVIKESN